MSNTSSNYYSNAPVEQLKVYWQPGCTSCLRMKEFLTRHGVQFQSINVLTNPEGLAELVNLAGRHIPIARRGNDWADGQVLADLARVAGIPWANSKMLDPAVMVERIERLLRAAQRLTRQIDEAKLETTLPDRPRSYAQLVAHIVQIVEAFLDLSERGKPLVFADYCQDVPMHARSKQGLLAYVSSVERRFSDWWERDGTRADFSSRAEVYYGEQTMHQFLERTVWHAAQHTRQLARVVESLGLVPDGPLGPGDLSGLPLPEHVWEDESVFDPNRRRATDTNVVDGDRKPDNKVGNL
jgi:hypothetical protein